MFITISAPLGSGETTFLPLLAQRLHFRLADRETLENLTSSGPQATATNAALEERWNRPGGLRRWLDFSAHYPAYLREITDRLINEGPCILVGFGAVHLYPDDPRALHVRLVAPKGSRAARLARETDISIDQALETIFESDRSRTAYHQHFFRRRIGDPIHYHLLLNTERFTSDAVVETIIAAVSAKDPQAAVPIAPTHHRRFLTISRQYGAGGGELGERLSKTIGWSLLDRELIHQSAELSGIPEPQLIQVDEHGPDFLERLHLLQQSARYFEALSEAFRRIREDGSAIVVGRGGNMLLDVEDAFHIRLVARERDRLERVMRRRWLSASAAGETMHAHELDTAAFQRHYFRIDADDPLCYHLTLNSTLFPLEESVRFLTVVLTGRQFKDSDLPPDSPIHDSDPVDREDSHG